MPTDKMIRKALDAAYVSLRTAPKPRPPVSGESKYGYYTTAQASKGNPLKEVLRGTKYSRKKVTLVRIPKGESD